MLSFLFPNYAVGNEQWTSLCCILTFVSTCSYSMSLAHRYSEIQDRVFTFSFFLNAVSVSDFDSWYSSLELECVPDMHMYAFVKYYIFIMGVIY